MKSKEKKETMKIGIIGAGYSGLSIAKELEKNGQEVTLFEKNRYVGGMVDTVSIYETRLEKYYRHIFKSDKEASIHRHTDLCGILLNTLHRSQLCRMH